MLKSLVSALVDQGGVYVIIAVLVVLLVAQSVMARRDRQEAQRLMSERDDRAAKLLSELQEKRVEEQKSSLKAATDAIHTNTLTLHTLAETIGRRGS